MARNFNNSQGSRSDFTPAAPLEPGAYPGRLVSIVFLGVQKQRPYKGQAKAPHDEVRYTFELSDEFLLDEDGNPDETKPRWVSTDYKVYGPQADKAGITKCNAALDPNNESEGDAIKLLGRAGNVVLVQNAGKGERADIIYNNITEVTRLPKMRGYEQPELVNPTQYFDPQDPDHCDIEVFRAQPEFVQKKILNADDFATSAFAKVFAADGGKVPPKKAEPKPEPEQDDADDADNPYA